MPKAAKEWRVLGELLRTLLKRQKPQGPEKGRDPPALIIAEFLEGEEGDICYLKNGVVAHSPHGFFKNAGIIMGDQGPAIKISINEREKADQGEGASWSLTVPIAELCAIFVNGSWVIGTPGVLFYQDK